MSTRKTSTSKNKTTPRSNHREALPSTAKLAEGAKKYALPAASAVGAGALAAIGFAMREQLGEIARVAIKEGAAATGNLSVRRVLGTVGLQRRRSPVSVVLQAIGVLAVGVVGGAALTYWLAPRVQETALGRKMGTLRVGIETAAPMPPVNVSPTDHAHS